MDFTTVANDTVYGLAIQVDGKILVAGIFTTLGTQTRNYFGRISASTAAQQDLSVSSDGSSVTWTRSGSSPEVWRTTFEQSTDGINYTLLGAGIRTDQGWLYTCDQVLPNYQNLWLRARGYFSTGMYNSSSSVVETIRFAYLTHSMVYLPLIIQ